MIDEITAELNAIQKLENEAKERGCNLITNTFEKLFAEYPGLHRIHWTQYTPSFNDGDPCYFSLGEIWVNEDEDGWLSEEEKAGPSLSQEQKDEIYVVLGKLNYLEEHFEDLYGDNTAAEVRRDGVSKESYDCGY